MSRRSWWGTSEPVVVKKKSRAIPKERPEVQMRAEIAHAVRRSESPTIVHPYEAARSTMNALELADYILRREGRLVLHCGAYFLDGKYELPQKRIDAANATLKSLGMAPIFMRRR